MAFVTWSTIIQESFKSFGMQNKIQSQALECHTLLQQDPQLFKSKKVDETYHELDALDVEVSKNIAHRCVLSSIIRKT